jgi:hypothetical protein
MFVDGGYRVSVNGVIQVGGDANPFVDLCWRRVSADLPEILDPENGGDIRLYRLLERAREADRQQRRRPAS